MHRRRTCLPTIIATVLALAGPAAAQESQGGAAGAGQTPRPGGTIQTPGEVRAPAGPWQQPGEVRAPTGPWQKPGEIRAPTGPWQKPGEIQVPKGIQAVRSNATACERRVAVVADALFDFDKSSLRNDAVETLAALGPEIAKSGKHPMVVEGHTDAIGTDAYNQRLSEQRALAVRDWLARQGFIPAGTATRGFGKTRPVAPNQTADGRDDPEGRQKNRRVELAINTCA
jgi:outer membrane protein OmpA-like peptidoglycan-associated protein